MTLQELLHINEICFGENKAVVTPQFGLTVDMLRNIHTPQNNFIYTGIADCCVVFEDELNNQCRFCFDYYCNINDVLIWLNSDLSDITSVQVSKIVRPGVATDSYAKLTDLVLKNGNVYAQLGEATLSQNDNIVYHADNTQLRWYLVSYSQSKKMVL